VLDLCQYAGHDRTAEVEADLEASSRGLDPRETLVWWLQWQELSGLLGAVAGKPPRMIQAAEASLEQVETVLEQAESFAEKSEYLSRLSFIADLGILGHLSENGPPAGLRFARRVFARLLGSETSVFATPVGVAELYLLNPVTPDWSGVLVSAGEFCSFFELEGVGKDFWNDAIEGLRPGFFSGMETLRSQGGVGQFAEALEEWIYIVSGALGPVLFDLKETGYEEIVVFAFGGWCTVPISALQLPGPECAALIDQAAIVHGPDQFIPHKPQIERFLHIVDQRLSEAETETKMVRTMATELVTCSTLEEVQAALSAGKPFDVIHFTTHGEHDFDYLEGAGIRCADDQLLTARWIFEHTKLKGGPLVCLAACQTGLTDFTNLPHETFGLPMAFLAAGANAVISTQWPVDDVATRLLLTRFYQELLAGQSTARALRRAQLWLRDSNEDELEITSSGALRFTPLDGGELCPSEKPFSHPYFWSGFLLHRA
jgi:CHAT domain